MRRPNALNTTLDGLWTDYATLNPRAKAVHDLLVARGERITNDHIAFRSFDRGSLCMETIANSFKALGYRHAGSYDIKDKHVEAIHMEPPVLGVPKVFISQLRVKEFSPDFQSIVTNLARLTSATKLDRPDMLWSGAPWGAIPSIARKRLAMESEYAAWLATFGIRANHFTVLVNDLTTLTDIRELNRFLRASGFTLNASGGEVKGSPQQMLEQSSTQAANVPVQFVDGIFPVPGCYYEFAKRYPNPKKEGRLFQGFIESSASKIFDSTSATAPVMNGKH